MITRTFLPLAALLMATSATAGTVLSDTFNAENGGATAINYTGFSNFAVTGTVDLVQAANPFGIKASSAVVDLDGTTGPGRLTSKAFAFGNHQKVKLTFVLGGAQRGSEGDGFYAGFTFGADTPITHYTLGGWYGSADIGGFTTGNVNTSSSITGTAPYRTYSLSFVTGAAGSVSTFIGTPSADRVGPLLDRVRLDIGTVPEPASWALMIAGFGLVGLAARRRGFAAA